MESPLAYALCVACVVLLLSSFPTPADARASPLVRDVCKETRNHYSQNYTQCIKTLWADARIRSSAPKDLKDLAINILTLAAETARDTQDLFNSYMLMINSGTSTNGTQAIQQCTQSYGSMASGFLAIQAEVKESKPIANYTAARIGDDINVCKNVLASNGVQLPDTISRRVQVVNLYKDIGFTITIQLATVWLHLG